MGSNHKAVSLDRIWPCELYLLPSCAIMFAKRAKNVRKVCALKHTIHWHRMYTMLTHKNSEVLMTAVSDGLSLERALLAWWWYRSPRRHTTTDLASCVVRFRTCGWMNLKAEKQKNSHNRHMNPWISGFQLIMNWGTFITREQCMCSVGWISRGFFFIYFY